MYLFVVKLKTALLLSANSIWRPPQGKTCCCSTLLSMGFFAMKKGCFFISRVILLAHFVLNRPYSLITDISY